ncbi:helix-turn-helix domain-containing protein [Citrobacter koseri]|uniref:helix-turn-helix domain-containing protein n=1 Tax=Citrobacter koseri TaxID=545 RepID=UPI001F37F4EC|nr:XRE family transcriptional regulator [Citrobacter koseri]
MATLQELLEKQSPESQARIKEKADKLMLEVSLQMLREELQQSQKMLSDAMGISLPAVTSLDGEGDPTISSLKRYVEAMGGKLSLGVELPTGKYVAFRV